MKFLAVLLLITSISITSNQASATGLVKDPIVIEVVTKHKSMEDALNAAKTALLKEKFIADEMQTKGFTAKRTTGARADYYVADVAAKDESGKIKVTITFVKVGTGLLKLQKVADSVKKELEAE